VSQPIALSVWEIFRWPTLIGVATIIGLVSALVGDGWYDAVSWLSLGFTLAVIAVAYRRAAD
jgi:uncharacterized membrane protein YjjP (DUF1212 family)